jgi:predicted membrane-bound mannosyltransferase
MLKYLRVIKMELKNRIAEKITAMMSKKYFAKWFLYIALSLAIITQIAAILIIFYHNTYGNSDLIKYATELTYSTIATCSIGFGGYFCFKRINFEKK